MRALADLEVLIIDCQATGATPSCGCVLELGFCVVRAAEPEPLRAEAHFIALPKGHVVPAQVRKLTGYDPMAARAELGERDAWERLRAAVGGAALVPTAIHFARFELPFLRDWSARFEPGAPFPLDTVCLYSAANRLYPELPRQSLRALAGYLGHGLELTRRSLGHVEATAFVWRRLCRELATRGILSWEELQGWLAERAPARPREKKPRYPIDDQRYRSLPDQPGVYRFLRSNGDVLYVGKAASLKRRVATHFVGRAGTPQSPEMLTQVSDIQTTLTPSALEAALLENETIKALRPPYNTQLTASEQPVWYVAREFDSASRERDARHPIGPVSSRHSLEPLAALLAFSRGAPALASLRPRALGVSALPAPDDAVFEAGWAEFLSRHPRELWEVPGAPRKSTLSLAKRLMQSATPPKSDDEGEALGPPGRGWDPSRVARHLERAIAQAYRAYRRARWLLLLCDCDVVYREPGDSRARLLVVREGRVVDARDAELDYAPEQSITRWATRREPMRFDRAAYERLRVLTTELKRIARDGGYVALCWGPQKRVPERLMAGLLSVA